MKDSGQLKEKKRSTVFLGMKMFRWKCGSGGLKVKNWDTMNLRIPFIECKPN